MHEISDLMQGFIFSQVLNYMVYISRKYFLPYCDSLCQTISQYGEKILPWSLEWYHWFRAWETQCMCTIRNEANRQSEEQRQDCNICLSHVFLKCESHKWLQVTEQLETDSSAEYFWINLDNQKVSGRGLCASVTWTSTYLRMHNKQCH